MTIAEDVTRWLKLLNRGVIDEVGFWREVVETVRCSSDVDIVVSDIPDSLLASCQFFCRMYPVTNTGWAVLPASMPSEQELRESQDLSFGELADIQSRQYAEHRAAIQLLRAALARNEAERRERIAPSKEEGTESTPCPSPADP